MPNIALKIDVTKLKKEWFFRANSGAVYADLILFVNDEPDKFGNDASIKQNPPKEARDAGEKGHYVGNGKNLQSRNSGFTRQSPQDRQQQRDNEKKARRDLDSTSGDDYPF